VLLAAAFDTFTSARGETPRPGHTDVSSLTTGVRELDDGQSLVRYRLFSHEFDVEGIIPTSNLGHGQTVRPEFVRHESEAYASLWPNLLHHASGYPGSALPPDRVMGELQEGITPVSRTIWTELWRSSGLQWF
jgi:hypothetical protein